QIKKNFSEVHAIRGLSGFGWDDGLKLVTATQDVWDRLFEAHPDYRRWQTTPFPLYDDMLFLVDGIIATGRVPSTPVHPHLTQTHSPGRALPSRRAPSAPRRTCSPLLHRSLSPLTRRSHRTRRSRCSRCSPPACP
ncbi:hypothetical protein K438DRAFT_1609487, partial [Mycena galopus ATCC 62051]